MHLSDPKWLGRISTYGQKDAFSRPPAKHMQVPPNISDSLLVLTIDGGDALELVCGSGMRGSALEPPGAPVEGPRLLLEFDGASGVPLSVSSALRELSFRAAAANGRARSSGEIQPLTGSASCVGAFASLGAGSRLLLRVWSRIAGCG